MPVTEKNLIPIVCHAHLVSGDRAEMRAKLLRTREKFVSKTKQAQGWVTNSILNELKRLLFSSFAKMEQVFCKESFAESCIRECFGGN